jgi:antitoxin ParD1/3/4
MPKPMSFTLGSHDQSFIEDMVGKGRFGTKTEVVRAGLRLLEDYENRQKLNRLRADIAEADQDIRDGHITQYTTAEALMRDVLDNPPL